MTQKQHDSDCNSLKAALIVNQKKTILLSIIMPI
jgi:hypothetical protein